MVKELLRMDELHFPMACPFYYEDGYKTFYEKLGI
jgi:hypothetical protein